MSPYLNTLECKSFSINRNILPWLWLLILNTSSKKLNPKLSSHCKISRVFCRGDEWIRMRSVRWGHTPIFRIIFIITNNNYYPVTNLIQFPNFTQWSCCEDNLPTFTLFVWMFNTLLFQEIFISEIIRNPILVFATIETVNLDFHLLLRHRKLTIIYLSSTQDQACIIMIMGQGNKSNLCNYWHWLSLVDQV